MEVTKPELKRRWKTKAGLEAVVILIRDSYHCGYVHVPDGHPLAGADYITASNCGVSAHGGLTFSATPKECNGELSKVKGGMWFGFDCNHYCDLTLHGPSFASPDATFRDVDFCVNECENMASQLKAVGPLLYIVSDRFDLELTDQCPGPDDNDRIVVRKFDTQEQAESFLKS